ncbi:MAG: transcription antitermination factor NusB [Chlamydiia bacterium]|nr:transcription antitermination factor NusB [Chlamydiia bacterium]
MSLPPQKFREIVFQILFSTEFVPDGSDDTALMLMGELKVTRKAVMEARLKAMQVVDKLGEIDEKIRVSSREYHFDRISLAEKCALRLGLFELFYEPSLPHKVAIAEAIRLTRKFGTPESSQFVNAILDAVYTRSTSKSPKKIELKSL